jgi:hypothetical protein
VRYRNPHPHTAVLPAHVDDDGRVHDAVSVEPGEAVDWPIPVAGFEPVEDPRPATRPAVRAAAVAAEDATEAGA